MCVLFWYLDIDRQDNLYSEEHSQYKATYRLREYGDLVTPWRQDAKSPPQVAPICGCLHYHSKRVLSFSKGTSQRYKRGAG